jgi:two-component system cell cycle response regulator
LNEVPARILIIEDNVDNRELMTYLLNAFGYATLCADDGLIGIELAVKEQPDLILCDIRLPGIDGYEVARRLKQDARLRTIPLIATTALAMVEDRARALAVGFKGYITKPIAPETFVSEVAALMSSEHRQNPATLPSPENSIEPAHEVAGTPTIVRGTILVVDNLQSNLDLARSIFEPSGFHVLLAPDINSAVALAEQEMPDVILSDVNMPQGSGFELASRVKRHPRLSAVPVVLISGTLSRDEGGPVRASAAGAAKFLSRPIDPMVLLDEIQGCLDASRHSEVLGVRKVT